VFCVCACACVCVCVWYYCRYVMHRYSSSSSSSPLLSTLKRAMWYTDTIWYIYICITTVVQVLSTQRGCIMCVCVCLCICVCLHLNVDIHDVQTLAMLPIVADEQALHFIVCMAQKVQHRHRCRHNKISNTHNQKWGFQSRTLMDLLWCVATPHLPPSYRRRWWKRTWWYTTCRTTS